jgi:dUTP pyrophosphatase
MMIHVQLAPGVHLPEKHSQGAAGFDLAYHSINPEREEVKLTPGSVHVLGTGVRVAIPSGFFGLLRLRSGWAKRNQMVLTSSGVIDSDYRGEVMAPVTHVGPSFVNAPTIKLGERFAQLLILPVPEVELQLVDRLNTTERGDGGFGSTGVTITMKDTQGQKLTPEAFEAVKESQKLGQYRRLSIGSGPVHRLKTPVSEDFIKDLQSTSELLVTLGRHLQAHQGDAMIDARKEIDKAAGDVAEAAFWYYCMLTDPTQKPAREKELGYPAGPLDSRAAFKMTFRKFAKLEKEAP